MNLDYYNVYMASVAMIQFYEDLEATDNGDLVPGVVVRISSGKVYEGVASLSDGTEPAGGYAGIAMAAAAADCSDDAAGSGKGS